MTEPDSNARKAAQQSAAQALMRQERYCDVSLETLAEEYKEHVVKLCDIGFSVNPQEFSCQFNTSLNLGLNLNMFLKKGI
jgi:hypothetical protein